MFFSTVSVSQRLHEDQDHTIGSSLSSQFITGAITDKDKKGGGRHLVENEEQQKNRQN
jgi:hypothetical protein